MGEDSLGFRQVATAQQGGEPIRGSPEDSAGNLPEADGQHPGPRIHACRSESGPVSTRGALNPDAANRMQAEDALRRSQQLFETLARVAPIGIFRTDPEGRCLYVNERWCEIAGMTAEDAQDEGWTRGLHPEDRQRVAAEWLHAAHTNVPFYSEYRFCRAADGRTTWVLGQARAERDESGGIVGFVGTITDITERKHSEEALRATEQGLRFFVEHTPAAGAMFDKEMRYIAVSRKFLTDYRISTLNVIGKCHYEILPEVPERWKQVHKRCLAGAVEKCDEDQFLRADGTLDWLKWVILPWRDAAGQIGGIVLFSELITDRKRVEDALHDANLRLMEADHRKDEFLAMLSHELRNPLAPIRNSLLILDRAPPGSPEALRARGIIDRQVGYMTRLIDDLLDMTRIARGKIQLQRERLDLNELTERTVEDHRSVFDQGRVHLEVCVAHTPVWVYGDRARLAQILGNLLQNAAKFSPPGSKTTVEVQADAASQEAVLIVKDTGSGIAPEFVPRLFEAFSQADLTIDRSKGGLGLGLALVRGLVGMHGGTVDGASGGRGKGATFTIRLPLDTTTSQVLPQHKGCATKGPCRILLIDDNVDAADSLKLLLKLGGHDVEVAYNGREGLLRARAFAPDIVLCDIGLPDMSGYEVARAMRADPDLGGIMLAALTGYARPVDIRKAQQAGFDAHLAKPLTPQALDSVFAQAASPRRCPPSS